MKGIIEIEGIKFRGLKIYLESSGGWQEDVHNAAQFVFCCRDVSDIVKPPEFYALMSKSVLSEKDKTGSGSGGRPLRCGLRE